jgi:hypothetical protein
MNSLNIGKVTLLRLAFLAAAVSLLACTVMWVWSATHPVRINVSRQEFQAALARWRALGVEEYEITVYAHAFIDGGSRTIHVGSHGESLISTDPPLNSPEDPREVAYVRSDTVEGMFEDIRAILDGQIRSDPTYYTRVSPSMAFTVKFDPQMGYPAEFSGRCHPAWPLETCQTADADWRRIVTSLKILKQTGPTPKP